MKTVLKVIGIIALACILVPVANIVVSIIFGWLGITALAPALMVPLTLLLIAFIWIDVKVVKWLIEVIF